VCKLSELQALLEQMNFETLTPAFNGANELRLRLVAASHAFACLA
jgi:hypothetical protein